VKISKYGTIILLSILLLGCGGNSDTPTKSENTESSQQLLARNISTAGNKSKQYFGKCEYKDGSALPLLFEVDNPLNDVVIFIYYMNDRNETTNFSAPVSNGQTHYVQNNAGENTLLDDWIWDIKLSENQKYYTGTINKNTAFECDIKAGLNVNTEEELESIMTVSNTTGTQNNKPNLIGTWKATCFSSGTSSSYQNTYIFKENQYVKSFKSYKNTATCSESGLSVHNKKTYNYVIGDETRSSDNNLAYEFDTTLSKYEHISGAGASYRPILGEKKYKMLKVIDASMIQFSYGDGSSPSTRANDFSHDDYIVKE